MEYLLFVHVCPWNKAIGLYVAKDQQTLLQMWVSEKFGLDHNFAPYF